MFGSTISSVYRPAPFSSRGSSTRRTGWARPNFVAVMILCPSRGCFHGRLPACTVPAGKATEEMMSEADRRIVVLNTGSSSLKFAAYPLTLEAPPLLSGLVDGIGGQAHLKVTGKTPHDEAITAADPHAAMQALADLENRPLSGDNAGFGHRIVHGGPDLDRSVLGDDAILAQIEAISPLAPLHNPP